MRMLWVFLIGLCSLTSPVHAATSTNLNAVWFDRSFDKMPLKKILVVSLSEKPDRRLAFENAFVDIIRKRGGTAESAVSLFGANQIPSKESVKQLLKEKGFDAVMVSRLLDVEFKTTYVENKSFDEEYQSMTNTTNKSGYLRHGSNVLIQTRIFDSQGQRIWSAESETFDPESITDLVASMAKAMGRDLTEKGFITPKR